MLSHDRALPVHVYQLVRDPVWGICGQGFTLVSYTVSDISDSAGYMDGEWGLC
jgi:hypothetical protein